MSGTLVHHRGTSSLSGRQGRRASLFWQDAHGRHGRCVQLRRDRTREACPWFAQGRASAPFPFADCAVSAFAVISHSCEYTCVLSSVDHLLWTASKPGVLWGTPDTLRIPAIRWTVYCQASTSFAWRDARVIAKLEHFTIKGVSYKSFRNVRDLYHKDKNLSDLMKYFTTM